MGKSNKKFVAVFMALAMGISFLPSGYLVNADTEEKIIYSNDFENEKLPDEVGGVITADDVSIDYIDKSNKMLKFTSKFDGGTDWDSNKHEFGFYVDYSEGVSANSQIQFDILIPTEDKDYSGVIKYSGGIGTHDIKSDEWGWAGANYGDIKPSDFIDLDNGLSMKTVTLNVEDEISVDVSKAVIQIVSYECSYEGDIYLDNIKYFENEQQDVVLPVIDELCWDFDNSAEGVTGWSDGGNWDYSGEKIISYDENTIGSGSLKLALDYSNDSASNWSEAKININFPEAYNFNGYNMFTCDFVYDPSAMSTGAFNIKLFIENAVDTYEQVKLSAAEDIGNGLKKVKFSLKFNNKDVDIDSITLGIIGVGTDYKGNIYLDNIVFGQYDAEDIYVERTILPTGNPSTIDINSLSTPQSISLVDSKATSYTSALYSYLIGVGKTDYVLYGHQNDTHHKAYLKNSGSNSDTKDMTGSISAICGIDTLSLTGAELVLDDGDTRDLVTAAADVSKAAAEEGAIVTLSAHMPNFAVVAEKGLVNGQYDYSGYTPNTTTGDVVSRIMPDGDLNNVYTGYLDIIADYANKLAEENIPVLFRPFHENNGSWFWWGKAFCDEEAYKNLYKYTVEYLRDVKNVHNFLYVYSPNGPFEDEADYLSRYPGDEFIDILAFDMYHDNPTIDDSWMNSFKETINLVDSIATSRNKLSTVSETGMRVMDSLNDGLHHEGLATVGNVRKDWFNEILDAVSDSNMPYFMVWANFDSYPNFFTPFMVSEDKGHEMVNNFVDFYNDERSVFANGVSDYTAINSTVNGVYNYGYISYPTSSSRIINPLTIKASIKGFTNDIKFIIKNNLGEEIEILNAKYEDELYTALISQDLLDKIGRTVGSIELYSGDTLLNKINILFNIEDTEAAKELVDDFEGYYGESLLLNNSWSTNSGPGCYINPTLSNDKENINSGEYGLAFNYKISTEKVGEGWAGMTKSIGQDWSEYDAIQFWCKPDGYGQKLVIQITSNGEDFEVWLPEFAATTEAQLVTLKFSEFKGKNNGELDLSNIEKFGIWCNTIVPEDNSSSWTVESTMYFDDIKAINTEAIEDDNKEDNNNNDKDDNSDNGNKEDNNESNVGSNGDDQGTVNEGENGNNSSTDKNEIVLNKPNSDKNESSELPVTGGIDASYLITIGGTLALAGGYILKKKKNK